MDFGVDVALGAVCCTQVLGRLEGLGGVLMFESVNKDADASSRLSGSSEENLVASANEFDDSNNGVVWKTAIYAYPGPRVIKIFSSSFQLSIIFKPLINTEITLIN